MELRSHFISLHLYTNDSVIVLEWTLNGMMSEPLMPVLTLNKFYYRFILLTLNGDPSSHFGFADASNGVKDLLGRIANFPEHAISYIRREGNGRLHSYPSRSRRIEFLGWYFHSIPIGGPEVVDRLSLSTSAYSRNSTFVNRSTFCSDRESTSNE